MQTRTAETRQLIGDLAAAAVCLWAGYFFCHKWQTLDEAELALLGAAVIGSYAGAAGITGGGRKWVAGVAALAVALAAAGRVNPLLLCSVAALFGLGLLRRRCDGTQASRFVLGLLLAGAALVAGVCTSSQIPAEALWYGSALAGYVGLAESLRGTRPVAKGTFAMTLGALMAAVLGTAAFGLARPFGLLAAAFSVWLGVYLGWYGRLVLKQCNVARLRLFGDYALAGTGLFAGALLALQIPEGQRSVGELAWPVMSGAFAVVVIRVWPYLLKRA